MVILLFLTTLTVVPLGMPVPITDCPTITPAFLKPLVDVTMLTPLVVLQLPTFWVPRPASIRSPEKHSPSIGGFLMLSEVFTSFGFFGHTSLPLLLTVGPVGRAEARFFTVPRRHDETLPPTVPSTPKISPRNCSCDVWSKTSEHTHPPWLKGETASMGTRTPRPMGSPWA